ncbi:MAG: hypothetical protein GEU92_14345 [Alphaproteobacteria bacterium]|nr:hypothetical protein [Alphaproteobacteria bacterium]
MNTTMTFLRSRVKHAAAVLAAAAMLAGFATGEAQAVPATYSSSADVTLRLVDIRNSLGDSIALPAGATVSTTAKVTPDAADRAEFDALRETWNALSGKFATGSSTATGSGTASTTSDSFSLHSEVSGTSFGPESLALQLTNGYFELDNASGEDLTFHFALDYSWMTSVAVTPQDFAEAIASMFVDIDGDSFIVVQDIFDIVDITDGSDGSVVSVTDYLFTVSVANGSWAFVDVFLDTAGYAVPAPASALLLAFGLAALRRMRNRAGGHA